MPLRAQNRLLLAGGFSPVYPVRSLYDPQMAAAKAAVDRALAGHAPFPALAVDRHWTLVASNASARLMDGGSPDLVAGPVNVLRLNLHPNGLAPIIDNLAEWRAHLLHRLDARIQQSGDPVLADLAEELAGYPAPPADATSGLGAAILVPLKIRTDAGVMSLLSTTTVFGTPIEVTLSELALECFCPADDDTRALLIRMA